MKIMRFWRAAAHSSGMFFCFFVFIAFVVTGTASSALVAGWSEQQVLGKKMIFDGHITLPRFDARQLRGESAGRCGEAPRFPVGKQTLVNIRTAAGEERKFVLYIPQAYMRRNGSAVALQLLFHGLSERCDHFINTTGFVSLAEKDGYILASLCGSSGLFGVGWNSGTCCGFTLPNSPDDFGFARSVVDVVAAGACVDRKKVMAVGFSNGAMMAEVLGCREPTVFRAVVSVAGVVELRPGNEGGLEACARAIRTNNTGGRRPSVLMVHGNLDLLVPVIGNELFGFPPLAKNVANWARINGCNGEPNVTIATSKYKNELYAYCNSSAVVKHSRLRRLWCRRSDTVKEVSQSYYADDLRFSIVEIVHALYGGHAWPVDDQFSTTNYIYEFGKRVFSCY